ncbi:MAG: lytic transglycosylase domain-containing protein [Candidatus Pacebacteria bacterium]|nr:lytic transglycosylase domain-containing protein [Candidatus Paceibacterota bacterium]
MKNFVLTLMLTMMAQQSFGGVCDCFIESHTTTNVFYDQPYVTARLIKSFQLKQRVQIQILQKTVYADNMHVWHKVMVDSVIGFVPAWMVFCLEKDSLAKESAFQTQLNPPTDAKHMKLREDWLRQYNDPKDLKTTAERSWERLSGDPKMLDYVYTQCEKHDVPYESAVLALIESAWFPHNENGAHAAGYWQFIPGTARQMGLVVNDTRDERLDPYLSTDAAIRYLRGLYDQFKSEAVKSRYTCTNDDLWHFAFSAYNRGPGKVETTFHQTKGQFSKYLDYVPEVFGETRNYVPKLYAMRQWLLENVGGIPRVIYRSPADVALQGYQERPVYMGQKTLDIIKGMYWKERDLLRYRQSHIDGILAKL